LIRSGGGSGKLWPCSSIFLYGDSNDAWNILWIFQEGERSSW
jgi:hypothetical protein